MKITDIDKKLFLSLYFDTRKTNSQLAKEIKLSRQQIAIKIDNYLQNNLIRFGCLFDYSKLGYNYMISLLIKTNVSESDLIDRIPRNNLISYGSIFGKYNLFVNMIFKDQEDFTKKMFNLLNSDLIKEFEILELNYFEMYSLKFLGKLKNDVGVKNESKSCEIYELDDKEKEILKLFERNSRIKIIDIALKLNLSSELVLYKVRKLMENKVILLNKVFFNMKELGFNYSIILIKFDNLDEEIITKIKKYSKNSKYVDSFSILNSTKYNCFIQYFHEEHNQLKNELIIFNSIFGNKLRYDIFLLDENREINTIPLL